MITIENQKKVVEALNNINISSWQYQGMKCEGEARTSVDYYFVCNYNGMVFKLTHSHDWHPNYTPKLSSYDFCISLDIDDAYFLSCMFRTNKLIKDEIKLQFLSYYRKIEPILKAIIDNVFEEQRIRKMNKSNEMTSKINSIIDKL